MEPCGTPAIISCQELELLFTEPFVFNSLDNFLCSIELLHQIYKPLTWQLIICGSVCQRPLTNP